MKKLLEKIIEVLMLGVFIFLILITYKDHSLESNLNNIIQILLWISIYIANVKWLVPKFLKERDKKYFLFSLISFILPLIIGIFFKTIHLEEMNYRRYYSIQPAFSYLLNFKWFYFEEVIYGIIIVYTISLAYGILRNIKYLKKKIFEKTIPIIIFSIILIGILWFCISVATDQLGQDYSNDYQSSFQNENIIFLEINEKSQTLEDLLNSIPNDKPTCILFWVQSCSGQINSLLTLDEIRQEISTDKINFIYIAGEYNLEEGLLKWKDTIISRNIEGYNIYLEKEQFKKIFIENLGIENGVDNTNLILISPNKEVISKTKISPQNKDDSKDTIKNLLLPSF